MTQVKTSAGEAPNYTQEEIDAIFAESRRLRAEADKVIASYNETADHSARLRAADRKKSSWLPTLGIAAFAAWFISKD